MTGDPRRRRPARAIGFGIAIAVGLLVATSAIAEPTPDAFVKSLLQCLNAKSGLSECLTKSHAGRWDYYNFVLKTLALADEKQRGVILKRALVRYKDRGVAQRFTGTQVALVRKTMAYNNCRLLEDKLIRGFRARGESYLKKLRASKSFGEAEKKFHSEIIRTYFIAPDAVWKLLFQCHRREAVTALRYGNRWRWGNYEADIPERKKTPQK
ncbi:MAG: hypothetical protein KC609_02365 [Myxococcales bacterium]|nr:hypothetical protein [Myxococcales bacterium]